jgi:hypothetical protein
MQKGMRSVRWFRLLALVPLFQFVGCATISTNLDPGAKAAGIKSGTRIILRGNTQGVSVYNDKGEKLMIVMVEDPTFRQALGNATAQAAAENSGAATYQTTTRISPAIFVSPKKDHTLRLVRADGSSVMIQRDGKVGKRWLVIDWLIFAPTLGFSLAVDWATGQWTMFEDINVDTEFRKAAAAASSRQ